MPRPRPLAQQVVVLTGASAGIGRATAAAFAGRGATLVLAARTAPALTEVAADVERLGGRAHSVVTDITAREQVERLAERALEQYGRIDTWVNNAGGTAFETVERMSIDEIERMIQLGLLGPIYGMKAALPPMRTQGYGTIINVASALAQRAVPLQGAYCAGKHGLKAITDALRMELRHERAGINVVLVMPASVRSTFFDNASSTTGLRPTPIPPVYEAEDVARAIVRVAERPKRHVYVGWGGRALSLLEGISPAALDRYMLQGGRLYRQQQAGHRNIPPRG